MYNYKSDLKIYVKELRKNMTSEEKHIWYNLLRYLPVQTKRQVIIENYIVDFYIPIYKTVIEIDGLQHYDMQHKNADLERDAFLLNLGLKVLRYRNHDINTNFNSVAKDILNQLGLSVDDLKRKKPY